MAALTPEAALLLAITRTSLDEASRERIRALVQSVPDWDVLHQLTTRHRLGMFLYVHLNDVAAPLVPRPVFMDLWKTYEENARLNASRVLELKRIVALLDAHNIPCVPYKGLISAQQIYGDIALREFEDQDLLVRIDEMAAVKTLLCANGYDVEHALSDAAEAAMYRAREQYHRVFIHRETREKLEVHWKTDPRFPIERTNDPQWWDSLPSVSIAGVTFRTFSAAEQLIILCLHGTKHQGHRLGWMLEVSELIKKDAIDWEWVERSIASLGCRRRVLVSLLLSEKWTHAVLPDRIRAAIDAEPAIDAIVADISARLFTRDLLERQEFDRLRLELKLYDRLRQRLAHVIDVTLAPTASEREAMPLPKSVEFFYWPMRMMKLAAKYAVPRSWR